MRRGRRRGNHRPGGRSPAIGTTGRGSRGSGGSTAGAGQLAERSDRLVRLTLADQRMGQQVSGLRPEDRRRHVSTGSPPGAASVAGGSWPSAARARSRRDAGAGRGAARLGGVGSPASISAWPRRARVTGGRSAVRHDRGEIRGGPPAGLRPARSRAERRRSRHGSGSAARATAVSRSAGPAPPRLRAAMPSGPGRRQRQGDPRRASRDRSPRLLGRLRRRSNPADSERGRVVRLGLAGTGPPRRRRRGSRPAARAAGRRLRPHRPASGSPPPARRPGTGSPRRGRRRERLDAMAGLAGRRPGRQVVAGRLGLDA